jgi:5-methylcytosine-specific restriction endonuclease McrA
MREAAAVEPWRTLYSQPQWRRARSLVLARDGRQCRGRIGRYRCGAMNEIQVHHLRPLRLLWQDAHGLLSVFMSLATDTSMLVTLCPRCHALAERITRTSDMD